MSNEAVNPDFEKGIQFLASEEVELEADFCRSLEKYGISVEYIEQFRKDPSKGWEFRSLDKESYQILNQRANWFERCVILEENLEETKDPLLRIQMEEELSSLKSNLALNVSQLNLAFKLRDESFDDKKSKIDTTTSPLEEDFTLRSKGIHGSIGNLTAKEKLSQLLGRTTAINTSQQLDIGTTENMTGNDSDEFLTFKHF